MLSLVMISCNSLNGSYVEKQNVNASIKGLMLAFDRATTGLRGKSANGRELVSRYQAPGSNSFDNAAMDKERAYSRLRILGDRRPYTLQIQHIIEKRKSDGVYELIRYDDIAAQEVLRKVLKELVTRPDREDFIDDIKAF